ncbi:MAG: hypothetical protein ABIO86_17650 [Sphingomonas sp.]
MRQEHEYALLGGLNRARIGRYLAIIAAAISSGIVFLLLTLVDVAHSLGLQQNIPPVVLSMVGAGSVYAALYALFDRHVWKLPRLSALLRVPNLSGSWRCEGQTINPDKSPGQQWTGEVRIVQSWDKIRLRLTTGQSTSNSVAAALIFDEADGYRLMYNYSNEPKITEPDLRGHRGFAELCFAKDCESAVGEYFNGHGRFTFGTMHLSKEAH